jgi:serine/threonine protein kinase
LLFFIPPKVKLRGIAKGPLCAPGFFIVLDRLHGTLDERLKAWRRLADRHGGCIRQLCSRTSRDALQYLLIERMTIAYDLAAAFFYLHEHRLVYRDIKPENIGFDIRGMCCDDDLCFWCVCGRAPVHIFLGVVDTANNDGGTAVSCLWSVVSTKNGHLVTDSIITCKNRISGDVKVFDFGLVKSLSPQLKARGGAYGYLLTGRAGSIPYSYVFFYGSSLSLLSVFVVGSHQLMPLFPLVVSFLFFQWPRK